MPTLLEQVAWALERRSSEELAAAWDRAADGLERDCADLRLRRAAEHDLRRRGERHRDERAGDPASSVMKSAAIRMTSGFRSTVRRYTSGETTLFSNCW
jgi:hypothetical protein